MSTVYVVVADSAVAKLFTFNEKSGDLNLIETMVSPDAREHDRELQSDKPGRVFDIEGKGRHSTEGNRSPKQQAAIRFSSAIGDRLKADLQSNLYDRLYCIAEPQFLGLLKSAIDDGVKNVLAASIPKNLTRHDLNEIRDVVRKNK